MALLDINEFKGLRQDIDATNLPKEYCHELDNIDVHDPMGSLSLRSGSSKLHANSSLLTDVFSLYEYRFDKGGETHLIMHDGNAIKTSNDAGATWTTFALPGDATLEASFKNQYFGYKDHVIITTGNGSTNYILWYGYTKRLASENDGLFGNVLEDTGTYRLLKSQLISTNNVFANIRKIIKIGSFYYLVRYETTFIEKVDSNFQFISYIDALDGIENITRIDGDSFVNIATEGTYIYISLTVMDSGSAKSFRVYKRDINTWEILATRTVTGGTDDITDICVNNTYAFIVKQDYLEQLNLSNLTLAASTITGMNTCFSVACSSTAVYTGNSRSIQRRSTSAIGTVTDTSAVLGDVGYFANNIIHNGNSVYVILTDFVSATSGVQSTYNIVYDLLYTTLVTSNTYTNVPDPVSFLYTTEMMCLSNRGTFHKFVSTTLIEKPDIISLGISGVKNLTGIDSGYVYYKVSIVDTDGQEFILTDSFKIYTRNKSINVYVTMLEKEEEYFYRIKHINIYRAFGLNDSESPETEYKFLKKIDINHNSWIYDASLKTYSYFFIDGVSESSISSVTYFENSGIGENIKPRYVNGKYLTFLNNQLHLANYHTDGEDYPYGFVRSPVNQPDNLTIYDPINYQSGGGEPIKDITNAFGRIMVFKNRAFAMFYDGVKEREYNYGLVSEGGYVKVNEQVYFVSEKNIYLFTGNEVITIGNPVKNYFDTISSFYQSSVNFIDKENQILFCFPKSLTLVLNLINGTWVKYGLRFSFRGIFKNYINEYIGFAETAIYKLYDGSTKDYEDAGGGNGNAIACAYDSPMIKFSNSDGELVSLVGTRHRLEKNNADTCTLNVYERDSSDGSKILKQTLLLNNPDGTSRNFLDALLGENFSFELRITANNDKFELHGFTIEYVGEGYEI